MFISQVLEYERITNYMLWFDVEKKYKTMPAERRDERAELWFDVEKK